jgi:CubicO group peptidase (beta-lactamase class C family)
MRRLPVVLTIAVLLLVRVPLHAQDLLFAQFRAYLEPLRVQAGIPGLAAGIVGRDRLLWDWAFGRKDLERSILTETYTPFHLDGLTQIFTASLVLGCVEEGRLSLDDRLGRFKADSPDPNATLRQALTHTSGAPDNLIFVHRPDRLEALMGAVRACRNDSYRETLANLLHRMAMRDSVPGPDVTQLKPPAEGIPDATEIEQYSAALAKLAIPYAVDQQGRPSRSQYPVTTLKPAAGLISTVRDFAEFDVALKRGLLLRAETLAEAWRSPAGRDGRPLPHGLGWFVQTHKGETIVWQFGVGENASSSLVITVPARGFTLILLANSSKLVSPTLSAGDLMVSPFARLFLDLFVR